MSVEKVGGAANPPSCEQRVIKVSSICQSENFESKDIIASLMLSAARGAQTGGRLPLRGVC